MDSGTVNKRRLEGTFSVAKWLRHNVSTVGRGGGTKILHAARKALPKTRTKEGVGEGVRLLIL